MPGHKGRLLGDVDWSALDITEVPGSDNLHAPCGVIKDLQATIAHLYGAVYSRILVGGSTIGNEIALLAGVRAGDAVLIAGNCHRSVFSGLALARGEGIVMTPTWDAAGFCREITPEQVASTVEMHPEAVGLVMTNPTYYGTVSQMEKIAQILHRAGKWLVVDEAHGAHLPFCTALPQSSVAAGADVVIQSAHKTLGAFTQSGLLHLGSQRISKERIARIAAMVESSSPSYPLMMGVEAGVADAANQGEAVLGAICQRWDQAQAAEDSRQNIRLYRPEGNLPYDKTKWVFTVADGTGVALEKRLREEHHIWCEFGTPHLVLAYNGMGTTPEDLQVLLEAVSALNTSAPQNKIRQSASMAPWKTQSRQAIPLWEAMVGCPTESLSLDRAAGRVSADFIVPYPPGIPVVLPGGYISQEMVDQLRQALSRGEQVNGIHQGGVITAIQ